MDSAPNHPSTGSKSQLKKPIPSFKFTKMKQPASKEYKPMQGTSASALLAAPGDNVTTAVNDLDTAHVHKSDNELTGDLSEKSLALAPKDIKWKQVHSLVPNARPKPCQNDKTHETWVKAVEIRLGPQITWSNSPGSSKDMTETY
ncbi:hypothetical protein FRC11_010087 [Ceratobasidium sp. 423]|nr:hypothetical protein FRC11_010087 [Ceratobasidium sp. 423]